MSLIIVQVALTIIKANKQQDLVANQENEEKVKYVASKKINENREEVLDDEKEPIDDTRTVPVPGGFTASQVPGERSIDTGFVIYEGDINWVDYINKDDLYNSDVGAETQIKLKNSVEETNNYQWILLDNGKYVSGYKDDSENKYGNYNIDNSTNILTSNQFTLVQPETLIIKWAVSSDVEDKLYYTIKNTETGEITGGKETAISGTTAGTNIDELIYTDTEVELGVGTYEIEFTYSKNGSNSEGLDAGFIKNIEYKSKEVKFTMLEGDGTTENNHHWLQYEDGTYVSGYVDETGKTYGNYHVPNSENILTTELTIEGYAKLEFEWAVSSEGTRYNDYIYYTITNKETGYEMGPEEPLLGDYDSDYASLYFRKERNHLDKGTYIVTFRYVKNDSYDEGLDAGFVKNIRITRLCSNGYGELFSDLFKKGTYQGGEYEENVWSTGYVKDNKIYGNYNINNSISALETEEIVIEGCADLKFEWSVSSESYDKFCYKIINIQTNQVINESTIYGLKRGTNYSELSFEEETFDLAPGTYKLEFIYVKNNSRHEGLDTGFVKNIRTVQTFTQTELNIFNLQKSTNQYVWVPISEYELEEIYGVDRNGKLWGKLYDKNYNPTTTHSSSGGNWEILEDGTMKIIDPMNAREPDVTRYEEDELHKYHKYDLDSQLPYSIGETRYELLSKEFEQGYYETIKSIKEYGGFYIGRYETGGTGVVRKMDYNKYANTWYSLYKTCNELKGENNNVRTDMIWGSLWDATLRWFIASGEKASNGEKIDNNYLTDYNYAIYLGNYRNSNFNYIGVGAIKPLENQKKDNRGTKIATGSTEYANINNIYDMAGNNFDYTLEVYWRKSRINRGMYYDLDGFVNTYCKPCIRCQEDPSYESGNFVCRSVLYIQ